MQRGHGLIDRIEQRLRDLDVPLAITLWNGQRVASKDPPRVSVTVRSPKVLASLVRPTMGKLARMRPSPLGALGRRHQCRSRESRVRDTWARRTYRGLLKNLLKWR